MGERGAALTTTGYGAVAPLPTAEQVAQFIAVRLNGVGCAG